LLKRNRFVLIGYFGGLILLPIILVVLPADFFDNGQSICLSVLLFDETCYGCGMTRAIQHLIHFDFSTAAAYNKLGFIVFFLLIVIWLGQLKWSYKRIKEILKAKT
jgi:hypothetical protein